MNKLFFSLVLLPVMLWSSECFGIEVIIKTTMGSSIKIPVDQTDTIEAVKTKVLDYIEKNIDPASTMTVDQIRFIFASKLLEDGRTVKDYNIQNDSVISWKVFGGCHGGKCLDPFAKPPTPLQEKLTALRDALVTLGEKTSNLQTKLRLLKRNLKLAAFLDS